MILAPVAIAMAWIGVSAWVWLMQFGMAFLSDWLDGKLARRWGTVTANLRQADSIADTFYTIGVVLSLWFSHPAIIASHAWGIAMIVFLEAARYPLDWYRFGRGASYHAYSAKLFGISIVVAVTAIIGFSVVSPFLWISLVIGIISEVEGILISLVLPHWTYDVKHLGIAMTIRRRQITDKYYKT